MDAQTTLHYDRGTLSGPELQELVDQILGELRNAPDLDEVAAQADVTADDLRELRVEITESASAIDPVTAFIVVHLTGGALSAIGGLAAKQVIEKILWPRVRRARAGDAIGELRDDDQPLS